MMELHGMHAEWRLQKGIMSLGHFSERRSGVFLRFDPQSSEESLREESGPVVVPLLHLVSRPEAGEIQAVRHNDYWPLGRN